MYFKKFEIVVEFKFFEKFKIFFVEEPEKLFIIYASSSPAFNFAQVFLNIQKA